MRILLDTHTLVWWLTDDPRLGVTIRQLIASADNDICVSPVSGWEIATKVRIGKWPQAANLLQELPGAVMESSLVEVPVNLRHAIIAGQLASDHRDPFDRMLAAQCQVEALTLATIDPAFRTFGTPTVW